MTTSVLRGCDAAARPARMSASLADSPFTPIGQADPRLVDPYLQDIVEQAENAARARGFRAGYDAGLTEGRATGRAELAAVQAELREREEQERHERRRTLQQAVETIRRSVEQAIDVSQPLLEERHDLLAHAAVEIAQALIGHHLHVGDCAAQDAVHRALGEVPRGARVTLRMNPADVDAIASVTDGVVDWDIVAVHPDAQVERYGCVAVAENLEVDAQLGPALENVKRVLRP